jgi:transposase
MALKAGVNANQLWRWIKKYHVQKKNGKALTEIVEPAAPAFVAAQQIVDASAAQLSPHSGRGSVAPASAQRETVRPSQRPPLPSRLIAQLPNGVSVELECAAQDAALVTAMIETLGRYHVPARR